MSDNPHRLGTSSEHAFHGQAIDRDRPLQFRLDGRLIHGFAGDTVLSAALASGIDAVGTRSGCSIALSMRHAPAIVPSALARDPQQALPVERTPATDGADYVVIGRRRQRGALTRLLRPGSQSLGLDLDQEGALPRPWRATVGAAGPEMDLVVVGGGVAGMGAALAGARRGLRVALIEATPRLGGHARLFGTQDGEETPDHNIAHLSETIGRTEAITVFTSAEVFALRPGLVRLHQVQMLDGAPAGRVIDIKTAHIVLATGTVERLPLFPGNRLPGIAGTLEAFELAHHYGVWPGRSAFIATSSSPAYRLAMLASDAGIRVPRIADVRQHPQSRFLEFSKAYGITLAPGTIPASAGPAPRSEGLLVRPRLAINGFGRVEASLAVDRLVVCGGWQADLTLWHVAGGTSHWNATTAKLEPCAAPQGMVLAGSAAGWVTRRGCLASGADAVDILLGRARRPVEDPVIDPIYDTPDAPTSIGDAPDDSGLPAFLDAGMHYLEWPRPPRRRSALWPPRRKHNESWTLADIPQPLSDADIAAGVQLGMIAPASAGDLARERVAMVSVTTGKTAARAEALPPLVIPPYLEGRFAEAQLWLVAPQENRLLETGTLIHAGPDETDPLHAIGVVLRNVEGAAIALVRGAPGEVASLREPGRTIAIRLVAPYRVGMNLAAALGSSAGTP
jgi:sarcosine oxidase subunit alpha